VALPAAAIEQLVLAALEIERLVSGLREKEMLQSRPYWEIRVGI